MRPANEKDLARLKEILESEKPTGQLLRAG